MGTPSSRSTICGASYFVCPGTNRHLRQPRLALGDVPSTTLNVPSDSDGGDIKRQRTGASIPQSNVQHQGQLTT